MTLLDTVNVGETDYGVQSRVPMGTCATPAGSEVKVCAFADNFTLSAGNLIAVTFTYANTYGDGSTTYPKLTINGVQYPVKFPTGEYASSGAWANGQAVTFMFDGTNLLMTTLPVTNEVALNNIHSVTSNAVYSAISSAIGGVENINYDGSITDCNILYESGKTKTWWVADTVSNVPNSDSSWYILAQCNSTAVSSTGKYATQIATCGENNAKNEMYIRHAYIQNNNMVWTAWQKVIGSSNIRTGYITGGSSNSDDWFATFDTPFADSNYRIICTPRSNTAICPSGWYTVTQASNGFRLFCRGDAPNVGFDYIAFHN